MVSKHHIFVWIPAHVLSANLIILVARCDDYFLGVLQSWPHELWSRKMGTQLREAESGYRYTPTTTFETFPFPWPPGTEPTDGTALAGIEATPKVWDFAAAWLIIVEAGGVLTDWQQRPLFPLPAVSQEYGTTPTPLFVAANPAVMQQLLADVTVRTA